MVIDEDDDDISIMKERVESQFFIDRDGIIQRYTGGLKEVILSLHYRIASDLFPKMKYPHSADDYVCKDLGWVMVGSSVYTVPIVYRKPSLVQLETLTALGDWYVSRLSFFYKDRLVKYSEYGDLLDD